MVKSQCYSFMTLPPGKPRDFFVRLLECSDEEAVRGNRAPLLYFSTYPN